MNHSVWQESQLANAYLDGVRGAIPLANEQIAVMLHLIRSACPNMTHFLDLGCGDGILGHALLDAYPQAHGAFGDFSPAMLTAAQHRLKEYEKRVSLINIDYSKLGWEMSIWESDFSTQTGFDAPFDVIISGFSIHHQPDLRKQELYEEIFALLKPGGLFLNLEHVASATPWVGAQFDSFFVDALYAYHQQQENAPSREQIRQDYYDRPDKSANILASVELQCQWLRDMGFTHVDCYLKIFELALFGGIKPT